MSDDSTSIRKTKSRSLELSAQERKNCTILIVDPDASMRHSMKQSIVSLGFQNVFDAADHAIALQRLEERRFTHIIFDAKTAVIPAKDFMRSARELERTAIFVASSYDPTVDDVFHLLTIGARGYIVKPFTSEALDQVLRVVTKGEPLCEAILNTGDRNEALAALVFSNVDKLATARRQARRFATAEREIPLREQALKRAVELGKTFARGGAFGLFEALVQHAITKSELPPGQDLTSSKRRKDRVARREPKRDPGQASLRAPKREPSLHSG